MIPTNVNVKLPAKPPICSFTQEAVDDPVYTVCTHFFEKKPFEEFGNDQCINCREKVTWYADVPKDKWGQEVTLKPRKVQIKEHSFVSHVEQSDLEVEIARNLICIAAAHGDQQFEQWCIRKNSSAFAQLNYDQALKKSWIEGLKKYPTLVKELFQGFNYSQHDTIQAFINAFLKEQKHFGLYNILIKQVYRDKIHEGTRDAFGGDGITDSFDEKQVIADVEWSKKIRSLVSLLFASCLIYGLGRRILKKPSLIRG